MKQVVLTGIKPTGTPHIGNYFGAIKQAIEMSKPIHKGVGSNLHIHLHHSNILSNTAHLPEICSTPNEIFASTQFQYTYCRNFLLPYTNAQKKRVRKFAEQQALASLKLCKNERAKIQYSHDFDIGAQCTCAWFASAIKVSIKIASFIVRIPNTITCR